MLSKSQIEMIDALVKAGGKKQVMDKLTSIVMPVRPIQNDLKSSFFKNTIIKMLHQAQQSISVEKYVQDTYVFSEEQLDKFYLLSRECHADGTPIEPALCSQILNCHGEQA